MTLVVVAALLGALAATSVASARLRGLAGTRDAGMRLRGPAGARARARPRGLADRRSGRDEVRPSRPAAQVRRGRPPASVEVDAALVLALVEAALTTGAAISSALSAVGRAVGGASGDALERAGAALVLGARWSTAWSGAPPEVRPVRDALESAWTAGAPPVPGLRARADRLRRERRRAVRTAAARLAVHLVVPLGVCFLPAFVLVGLVPIVLSLTSGLALLP